MNDVNDVTSMLNTSLDNNLNLKASTTTNTMYAGDFPGQSTSSGNTMTAWNYWQDHYYPYIRESYPVYIGERAKDKGKQAFEIIKVLKDKKLVQLKKVGDFIDLMDELIKIL